MSSSASVVDAARRLLDAASALAGLVVLSPLFLAVAVAIKLDSPGPVFYKTRRVGRYGQEFLLYKFRSMVANAEHNGPAITAVGDQRVTRIGRFLRRSKLDELPQLINVLQGDMSLVGPRPEDPRYVALYTPEQRAVLQVRPGITSAASLAYWNEEQLLAGPDWEQVYRTQVMPSKLAIDLAYQSRRTLASDMRLVLRTVLTMFR